MEICSGHILSTSERVGYDGCYCIVVPDHAAGRKGRYTVYRLPASPSRRVRVIGRELTFAHAYRVAMRASQFTSDTKGKP